MPKETTNYLLKKPLYSDNADIAVLNENFDEIVALGEQLLNSTNMQFRMGTIQCLCYMYLNHGDKEKALQYADMIPPAMDLRLHVLEGDELVKHCQNYFWKV